MRVGIVGYKKGKEAAETVKKFAEFLCAEGYDAVEFASHTDICGVDVVLVLGGDGAILHSSIVAAKQGIKIIGINFGTLGFLTEYEKSEKERVKELLIAIKNNSCRVLKRSILQIGIGENVYYALNEVSIQRDYGLNEYQARQILSLELRCREGVDVISGDGILVCTPTGSTAYSLSAGGPVVEPTAQTMSVTPICTHNMRFSSYVLSPEHTLTVELERNGRKPVYLFVDESRAFALRSDDRVIVRRSKHVTKLVRLSERSFCEIFAQKMLPGGLTNEK